MNMKMVEASSRLLGEITNAINRVSRENMSGTPDFILAEYLMACLIAFENAVEAKGRWGKIPVGTLEKKGANSTTEHEPLSMPLTDADRLEERVSLMEGNAAKPNPQGRFYRDFNALKERIALLESQRDELMHALVESTMPYVAILMDAESRKWIAPVIWEGMEKAHANCQSLLSRIAAGKPDPRLGLTKLDLEAALQWHCFINPSEDGHFSYPETKKKIESIISALEPADGEGKGGEDELQ